MESIQSAIVTKSLNHDLIKVMDRSQTQTYSLESAGTVLYVAFFALGAGAVPGLIVPELNSARLRGKLQHLLDFEYLKGKHLKPDLRPQGYSFEDILNSSKCFL